MSFVWFFGPPCKCIILISSLSTVHMNHARMTAPPAVTTNHNETPQEAVNPQYQDTTGGNVTSAGW